MWLLLPAYEYNKFRKADIAYDSQVKSQYDFATQNPHAWKEISMQPKIKTATNGSRAILAKHQELINVYRSKRKADLSAILIAEMNHEFLTGVTNYWDEMAMLLAAKEKIAALGITNNPRITQIYEMEVFPSLDSAQKDLENRIAFIAAKGKQVSGKQADVDQARELVLNHSENLAGLIEMLIERKKDARDALIKFEARPGSAPGN
ncbi:MAG: hypothetical protein V4736_08325 [Bdellovibrionota bacterium]